MGKKSVEKFRIRKNRLLIHHILCTKVDACEFDDMFCSSLFLDRHPHGDLMIPPWTFSQSFVEAFSVLFFFLPFAICLLPFEVTRVYQGLLRLPRVTKG